MAGGERRGNREAKKPKKEKPKDLCSDVALRQFEPGQGAGRIKRQEALRERAASR